MLCNCCCGTRRSIRQALILAAAQLAVAFGNSLANRTRSRLVRP